jgi:Protein of unknown function (DUF1569)
MSNVKTGKVSGRRSLQFASLDEVLADLSALEAAQQAGTISAVGDWSPGEVFDHLANLFEFSIDGFPFKAPLLIRIVGRLIKSRVLKSDDISAGIKLKGGSTALLPKPGISFESGMDHLKKQILRVQAGKLMTQRSPIFGALSHEQWMSIQLKHCALHLSFLQSSV